MTAPFIYQTLSRDTWQQRSRSHTERLSPIVEPYLKRRSQGKKAPMMDFLFEYYAFRPTRLMRWSPGFGVLLKGDAAEEEFLERRNFARIDGGVAVSPDTLPDRRKKGARWIRELLAATRERPPFPGCFGMHEWAMVYKTDDIRHDHLPMRLEPDELADFVESQPIICSHFDAFRFFSDKARPFNRLQPTMETMAEMEQPACLHTNMDLYKWAYKFYPWIGSDLIADAFELALEARRLDMRASPYDMTEYGLKPVPVETPEGRRLYRDMQMEISRRSEPIREELIAAYDTLLGGV